MDNHTILIVDDEPNIINSLKRLLRKEGYNLLTSTSGKEGLQLLKENKNVSLIITDHRMPEMSGIDFLREAKTFCPDTIRILLSGYAEVQSIMAAINEGEVYRFVAKPWNDEEIKVTIRISLEQYELTLENRKLNKKIQEQNELLNKMVNRLERKVHDSDLELLIKNQALLSSQNIVEKLPFGIVGIDADRNVILENSKSHKFFGFNLGKTIGKSSDDIFSDEIDRLIEKTIRTSETQRVIKHKVLNNHDLYIDFIPFVERKELLGIILLIIDIKEMSELIGSHESVSA